MKGSPISQLKHAITVDFAVHLASLGYHAHRKHHEFYIYRREREHGYDLVEVQIDKYHRPKFVVNFGVVPKEGIVDPYGRFVSAEQVSVSQLICSGRLFRWPHLHTWFRITALGGAISMNKAVLREINRLKTAFDQVERWFQSKEKGPNLAIKKFEQNRPCIRKASMIARGAWPPEGWTSEDEEAVQEAQRHLHSLKRE